MAVFWLTLAVLLCGVLADNQTAISNGVPTQTAVANNFTTGATTSQQQRHPGCDPAKRACVWPIDLAEMTAGSLFDCRVEVHLPMLSNDYRVTIEKVPGGAPASLDSFFGAMNTTNPPYMFSWYPDAQALADNRKINETVFSNVWRNVSIPTAGTYRVLVLAMGEVTSVTWTIRPPMPRRAKNVILFIADGMTVPMITAARLISRGQVQGKFRRPMYMDTMPYIGLVHTSGVDGIITDSANSATAYNTGHKSSVNALNVYADTSASTLDDPKQETIAERASREKKMAIGIVSTAEIQDATPAAVWAHTRRRSDKDIIVDQLLNGFQLPFGNVSSGQGMQADVIMGGGGAYFHAPKSLNKTDYYGAFAQKGYKVVLNRTDMLSAAADPNTKRLLGIYHEGNMDKWLDRNVYTQNVAKGKDFPDGKGGPAIDQPGLVDMLNATLRILERNPNGFFLMIEAANVDKMMHAMDWDRGLSELIEYDEAVGYALAWNKARGDDTLIIATADHGHAYDVYGTVDTALFNSAANKTDSEKKKAIGLYQDAGYPGYTTADVNNYPDTWEPRITLAQSIADYPAHKEDFQVARDGPRTPAIANTNKTTNGGVVVRANPKDDPFGIPQNGNLPDDAETTQGVHTLTDVPVFAQGPGAIALARVQDNTNIYFAMADALGFGYPNDTIVRDTLADARACASRAA